jgi:hypothetical protein
MRNWKPRDGGHFLWKQAYEVCKMGSKFMYVAMFDEVDEGTAMYKLVETVDDLPVGADQVPLNEDGYDLPSDWYLQVGTEIQKMLEGTIPVTATLPINPSAPLSLTDMEENSSFAVYPVPAANKLYIAGNIVSNDYKIFSIIGALLLEGTISNKTINVNKLVAGLYLLQLDGKVVRFIKK